MNSRTEQLIILKMKSGDKEAYGDLYNEYSSSILQFIYYRVSDRELAKDLTQEVFIKFIELLDKDEDKERLTNIKAYLYKIAKNLVIDSYRASDKQPVTSIESLAEVQSILGKESVEARIDLEIVIKETDKLKPIWKEIILLRIIDGFEYQEIASILGKSKNYIRVNLHRAMKELNKKIQ